MYENIFLKKSLAVQLSSCICLSQLILFSIRENSKREKNHFFLLACLLQKLKKHVSTVKFLLGQVSRKGRPYDFLVQSVLEMHSKDL